MNVESRIIEGLAAKAGARAILPASHRLGASRA